MMCAQMKEFLGHLITQPVDIVCDNAALTSRETNRACNARLGSCEPSSEASPKRLNHQAIHPTQEPKPAAKNATRWCSEARMCRDFSMSPVSRSNSDPIVLPAQYGFQRAGSQHSRLLMPMDSRSRALAVIASTVLPRGASPFLQDLE